jgi:hypothetical protein
MSKGRCWTFFALSLAQLGCGSKTPPADQSENVPPVATTTAGVANETPEEEAGDPSAASSDCVKMTIVRAEKADQKELEAAKGDPQRLTCLLHGRSCLIERKGGNPCPLGEVPPGYKHGFFVVEKDVTIGFAEAIDHTETWSFAKKDLTGVDFQLEWTTVLKLHAHSVGDADSVYLAESQTPYDVREYRRHTDLTEAGKPLFAHFKEASPGNATAWAKPAHTFAYETNHCPDPKAAQPVLEPGFGKRWKLDPSACAKLDEQCEAGCGKATKPGDVKLIYVTRNTGKPEDSEMRWWHDKPCSCEMTRGIIKFTAFTPKSHAAYPKRDCVGGC